MDFEIGERVRSSNYGLGTVGWIGEDYVGVEFDNYGKSLLRRENADLQRATGEDESKNQNNAPSKAQSDEATVRAAFFVREDGNDQHFMGSHWTPFFDDVEKVAQHLRDIIAVASAHGGYSQFYPPPNRAPVEWPRGAVSLSNGETLAEPMAFERKPHPWDHMTPWRGPGGALEETPERAQAASERDTGIATVLKLADSEAHPNQLCSLFPYCFYGIKHTLVLKGVRVWENGLEAHVDALLGEASITFYDIDFVNNRDWYQRGRHFQFILVGLAYDASPADVQSFTIPRTREYFDSIKWLTGEDRMPESGAMEETFSTEGMSTLLPVDGWDRDDYEFRGPVKEVWGMSILGLRAWRVRITVMRLSGHEPEDVDVDLDIIVTERVWEGNAPPKAGQELEGRMWLQGRLWST